MAEISVGAAIGSGFGLITRKPLTVLAWGALQVGPLLLLIPVYIAFISSVLPRLADAGSQPTQAQMTQMMGTMFAAQGGIFLGAMVAMLARTMVWTASWRAVLQPERHAWGYLRLGKPELFIILLLFAAGFAANLVMLPLVPFIAIVVMLLVARQWIAAIVVGVLALVAMIAVIVYLELRFVLLGPMIVDDGEFRFVEAWRLSKGRVGSLFLIGLSLVGVGLGVEVLGLALGAAVWAIILATSGFGFDHLQGFIQQPPATLIAEVVPYAIGSMVLSIPIVGALSAIFMAPWARAYRDLVPAPTGQTFA
ncbi:MAG TPA: hypothetical protein VHX64_04090 [Caulobacteraceae bacterium]|jgi:hypothetical protein|nr:hypothetical protein [Caulobacteraceae bacterium]